MFALLLVIACGTGLCQASRPSSAAPPAASSNDSPSPAAASSKTNSQNATQSASPTRATKASPTNPAKKSKPALDATQKQALSILQAVESDLGRYSPEMQTYLLQEMARAYGDLDRAKQVELLKEAFQSATSISDDHYRTQQETAVVRALNLADPAALLDMQYSPDPNVREVVLSLLVQQDMDKGRLLDATKRLSQWDTSLKFPYGEAEHLINKLTAQQSGERAAVFSAAVAAYRNREMQVAPENGMTELILGTYSVLPPVMVLDAIDLVLSKVADFQANHTDADSQISITMRGKNGQANFSNMYDLELFEFLPVLQKLDPAKAESLKRDHTNIAALSRKYPDGKGSVSPGGADMNMMFSSGPSTGAMPAAAAIAQQTQTADAILESANRDVSAAIAGAQTLPNTTRFAYGVSTPQCGVLEKIAGMEVGRKNYPAALAATKALANSAQDLPAMARAHYLLRAAAFSAQANDPQGAKQYLGKAMKAADDLYQTDAFGDTPNEAPKSLWPSTAAWRGTVIVAQRIDPGYAAQQAASLPDPEIEAVAEVSRATVMLNQEPGMIQLAVWQKGETVVEMFFDVPWWSAGSSAPTKGGGGIEKAQASR